MLAEEALRLYPGARKTAVMNFVGTLTGLNEGDEIDNMLMDAKMYSWDNQTLEAISYGIHTYYKSLN